MIDMAAAVRSHSSSTALRFQRMCSRTTNLVEMLQTQFGLTGARESCGQGLCGCCTVIVNDLPVSACLFLASFVDGAEVATVESLDSDGNLSSVQEAFIEAGAFQWILHTWLRSDDDKATGRASRTGRRNDQALPQRQSRSLCGVS